MREDMVMMVNHLSDWIWRCSGMFTTSVPIVMQLPDDWWDVVNDLSRDYHVSGERIWEILSHILWRWGKNFSPVEVYMMVSEAMEDVNRRWNEDVDRRWRELGG